MVATFCLRLACGLVLALMVLVPAQVPPRFFRVQYLTALGLSAVAGFFLRELADVRLWHFSVLARCLTLSPQCTRERTLTKCCRPASVYEYAT